MTELKEPKLSPRYKLCSNARAYELLGQQAFIKLMVDYPKLRLYEYVAPGSYYYYGLSPKPYETLAESSLTIATSLDRIRRLIMEEAFYNGE